MIRQFMSDKIHFKAHKRFHGNGIAPVKCIDKLDRMFVGNFEDLLRIIFG